ncbi:MAG: PAS domain-containing protein [Planctomycetaceae bacterium]|nr:PAS domain-containing protein [Planctomycetaceae bacterium]
MTHDDIEKGLSGASPLQHCLYGIIEEIRDLAILILDADGFISGWNHGTELLDEWQDDLRGRHVASFYTPQDIEAGKPHKDIEIALHDGQYCSEGYCMRRGGERFWAELRLITLRGAAGELGGFIAVIADLTARRKTQQDCESLMQEKSWYQDLSERLRASEERLTAATRETGVGIFDWNMVTGMSLWSEEFEKLFGFDTSSAPPAEMVLRSRDHWAERIHPDDVPGFWAELAHAKANHVMAEKDFRVIWPDGGVHWLNARGRYFYDQQGQPVRLLGTAREITERKLIEQQLMRTADELARSNADLEQFAHVASHDLKEPRAVIQLYLTLLEKKTPAGAELQGQQFIEHAAQAVHRMSKLISDLLAYSRVGRAGDTFELTDLNAVLGEVLQNLEAAIEAEHAVITRRESLPSVLVERPLVAQLLQNLIGNAIKYHADGCQPHIEIGARRQERAWLFWVKDDGIGIDPQDRDRIFMIFHRVQTQRQSQGTGIGLAICKKIAEHHYGRIWVESQPGQGATFYFTIPDR